VVSVGASEGAPPPADVGRRQGLIALAAATLTFGGLSLNAPADALEENSCLECGGAGVVACE